MILYASFFISMETKSGQQMVTKFLKIADEREWLLRTSSLIIAQVWRGERNQARLAGFLKSNPKKEAKKKPITPNSTELDKLIVHHFDFSEAKQVGKLLSSAQMKSNKSDVIDAHIAYLAVEHNDNILTADKDYKKYLTSHLGADRPTIHHWGEKELRHLAHERSKK